LVEGEVYEVDNQKLVALDELENHPHFYMRVEHQVEFLVSGEKATVFVYMLPQWKETLVTTGSEMLISYNTSGAHGRQYAEK
jgi:gamma-glutamylcyclotransferase (GGCT)/AIG2-like uncharacterized protein YtfP